MCDTKVSEVDELCSALQELNEKYLKLGLTIEDLQDAWFEFAEQEKEKRTSKIKKKHILFAISVGVLLVCIFYQSTILSHFYGIRCLVPNNVFIYEATRPIADCEFCIDVTKAIVLPNLTRSEFSPYAYSSKPIVIKGAFLHWPAMKVFDFNFFKDLYDNIEDAYRSVDEECQFLHFKSNFISLRDVFTMSKQRILNYPGETSWYIGWGNCHPDVVEEMRKYYPAPHFLPEDAEYPHKDYIFMGYDDGATMHLDFINRLMWQAQLKGSKTWKLLPPPECEDVCTGLEFFVEPGDAVLVDTRVWYHATTITPGEFSLSVQSEYG